MHILIIRHRKFYSFQIIKQDRAQIRSIIVNARLKRDTDVRKSQVREIVTIISTPRDVGFFLLDGLFSSDIEVRNGITRVMQFPR